ncbi:MAG: large conductance mechanosensitive channel protein MscL [Actinomycetaceae bacterium]|nr:large conductance mechanosensitive channel protein MscL [Actinomycetaceae bacterium]MDO5746983.1 large conductance mechanosensitive channel protein MscL [Actinomycetaceae bacterium]
MKKVTRIPDTVADTAETAKGFLAGFKEFVSRGNAMELAVGVVIGAAFSGVVNAITDKFINPLVAGLVGEPNFDDVLAFKLGSAVVQPGAIITAFVNFLLVALAVYLLIVIPMNKLHRKNEEDQEDDDQDEQLVVLTEIRDILKNGEDPHTVTTSH